MVREINGLKNAMNETGLKEGVIITYNQEDILEDIPLIPAWKWI
jgi:predicted AAA+ superfamily ATPase